MEWRSVEPNVWKPEVRDDKIEGVLVNVVPRESATTSTRYYIENRDGQHLVWGSTVLDDRMKIVPVGRLVRITFKGRETNKKGQPLKIFKVEVASDFPQVTREDIAS